MRLLVVDASALVDLLLRTPRARPLNQDLTDPEADLHVPALCDLEVVSALRTILRRNLATVSRTEKAIRHYLDLPLSRHGHQRLLPRCFQLRDVLSPYDAAYIALAEDLGADLVTTDRRLAQTAGTLGVSCPTV
ncbi:MAG: type II toxin-antitoxin system VapC family toxin [Gemmatimonadetes bacterium]|nr:type II toxin-antitoxin system VapC family toxin [Gemmatimonadota bacterium]NNM06669.1 type II toxin-antitoxin system VapC family toxin [Gemmatimonadota bacterium]